MNKNVSHVWTTSIISETNSIGNVFGFGYMNMFMKSLKCMRHFNLSFREVKVLPLFINSFYSPREI